MKILLILPNKIKNPILTIEKLINLPANGSMEIFTKNKPTKGKYILIQSDVGIYDGDNGLLNQQELENLLENVGGKIKCRKRKIKCRIFATNYLSFNLKLKL